MPGWPYSFVAALESGRTSWCQILDVLRLGPADDVAEVTPARVRRGFRNLRLNLPCPARAPKPNRPGPGRPLGSKNRHLAARYDVGKMARRLETIAERDHVRP